MRRRGAPTGTRCSPAPASIRPRSRIRTAGFLADYVALLRGAKEATGDPAFALNFGEAVDIRDLSITGLLGQSCGTVMEAFGEANRYARLDADLDMGGADRLRLVRDEAGLWVVDARPDPNRFPELTESAFARMVSSMRRFGVTAPPPAVHVTHKAPAWRDEYDRVFGVAVQFESPWNAIRIDETLLGMPVALQPRYVHGLLSARADALLAELDGAGTTRGQVECLLLPLLPIGRADVGAVARGLGMSRQTLYRRLKAEGVTFEAVRDALRHKLSLEHLKERSVSETAHLLGFSDRAAFARAFKRWTGTGPGARRKAGG
jgi:AraC-like DNA-binding protein